MADMLRQVLDCNSSHSAISRAALGSLKDTVEKIPVQLPEGQVDWTIFSLTEVLEYMIAESPNFKQAISEICAGGHAIFLPHCQAVTTAS